MTKNKTIYVALRMNELEASKLDYIRKRGETRSAAIRRLINEAWCDLMHEQDAENRFNVTDYLPPNI